MLPSAPITLSLDPTSGGFCYAVLQGPETLLDWGSRELPSRAPEALRQRIGKITERYHPTLIVIEDTAQSRRGEWARESAAAVEEFSREQGIEIVAVSRRQVQEDFAATGKTKYHIAVAISRLFPELEPRLPRKRKAWMSEDERMSIFDAISLALVALRSRPLL
jgi:hypothetical protein